MVSAIHYLKCYGLLWLAYSISLFTPHINFHIYISMTDSQGAECLECNAPCIEVMNECTGLPQVSDCSNGRDGVDDPSCTLALRKETCEGGDLSEEACTDLGCCSWDPVARSCNAACRIPEDGDACCATGAPTASLTDNPTPLPTKAASDPTPAPTVRTPIPTSETFSIPTTTRSPNVGTLSPTNSRTIQTTPSPTSKPSSQSTNEPTYQPVTPEPTPQPAESPSSSPATAPVPLPSPDNSRSGSNENAASTSKARSIAALVAMGLVAASSLVFNILH